MDGDQNGDGAGLRELFQSYVLCQGGATVFPILGPGVDPLHVQPVAGDALLFSNVLFPSGRSAFGTVLVRYCPLVMFVFFCNSGL